MPNRENRRERISDRDQDFRRAWRQDDDDARGQGRTREERAFGGYPDYDRDRRAREDARGRERDYEAGERSPSYPGAYGWRGQHHEDEPGAFDDPEDGARGPGAGHYGGQQPYAGQSDYGQGRFGREHARRAERDRDGESRPGRNEAFDNDYRQWRSAQMRSLDEDYRAWCDERSRRFAEDFESWRRERRKARDNEEGAAAGSSGGGQEQES